MATAVSDAQEHWYVTTLGLGKSLIPEGKPIHRIVFVLQEIAAIGAGKSVHVSIIAQTTAGPQ
jgi:hypothetical protein